MLHGQPGKIWPASSSADTLTGAKGLRIDGIAATDFTGTSVAGIGDFNSAGTDDVLIGATATDANGMNSGSAYVVFGGPIGFGSPFALADLNGANGFTIVGAAGSFLGSSAAGIGGHFNGDIGGDLLLGSFHGDAHVVFGAKGSNSLVVNPGGKSATYTDLDGDLVTVAVTKGTLIAGKFHLSGAHSLIALRCVAERNRAAPFSPAPLGAAASGPQRALTSSPPPAAHHIRPRTRRQGGEDRHRSR